MSNQQLYFFTTTGKREPPRDMRTVSYWLDNCALSLLTDPVELHKSPAAQDFRKLLRTQYHESVVLYLGPAVLERYLMRTTVSLNDMLRRKTELYGELMKVRCAPETAAQFQESVGFVLSRLIRLLLMIVSANDIFKSTNKLKEPDRTQKRLEQFAEWASQNWGLGTQTSVAFALYSALAGNSHAQVALGLAKDNEWSKMLNSAWDLKHWDIALDMKAPEPLPPVSLLKPVAVFVTADRNLSKIFSSVRHTPNNDGMIVEFNDFPKNQEIAKFVQSNIHHIWPRLESPHDYAEDLFSFAKSLETYELREGKNPTTTGLIYRCKEVGGALFGRKNFAIDSANKYM